MRHLFSLLAPPGPNLSPNPNPNPNPHPTPNPNPNPTGGGRPTHTQLKLKELIISAFVPREESEKVRQAAVWDDEAECWVLQRLRRELASDQSAKAKRPVSASGLKRPMSDYAKIASAMGDQVGGSVRSPLPLPSLTLTRLIIKGAQFANRRPGGELPLAVAAVGAGVGLLSWVGLLPAQGALSTAP